MACSGNRRVTARRELPRRRARRSTPALSTPLTRYLAVILNLDTPGSATQSLRAVDRNCGVLVTVSRYGLLTSRVQRAGEPLSLVGRLQGKTNLTRIAGGPSRSCPRPGGAKGAPYDSATGKVGGRRLHADSKTGQVARFVFAGQIPGLLAVPRS